MINLLSRKRLKELRLARSNAILSRYVKLVAASAVVLGAIVVGSYYLLDAQKDRINEAQLFDQQRISQLEPYQQQAKDLAATVRTISDVMDGDVHFSDVLTKIGGLMPPGAALDGLQISVGGLEEPMVVTAYVDQEDKSIVLLNNLKSSTLFDSAEIKQIESLSSPVGNYNFLVTLSVHVKKGEGGGN